MKPLGRKAYGSIGHLPTSRLGPGDHHVTEGQARICTEKPRDFRDLIIVQEKLDGSNTAVAKVQGQVIPLTRAGYHANSSPYQQHHKFAAWVQTEYQTFDAILTEGERLVGEWCLQAHGTRYHFPHIPWIAFDIMRGEQRATYQEFLYRVFHRFPIARLLHYAYGTACPLALVQKLIRTSGHGALDPVEGAVWRVERENKVDFLAKWVYSAKVDGQYLDSVTGGEPVWNTWEERKQ